MNALYTLAYPTISATDSDRLEAFRRRHDPRHEMVPAHFTLVFGCSGINEQSYIEHVAAVSRVSTAIRFSCRYAMLGSDDEVERGYVYLVPDEGFSGISRLHDALYRGPLSSHLRLDIPFVPHMTVGASADRNAAKCLCDELNAISPAIHGAIEEISVVALRDGKLLDLAKFSLDAVSS